MIIGFISGVSSQRDWFFRILRRFGFSPIHIVPNAWDYKFSKTTGEWVIVTLKNDTIFRGWWGGLSFSSSDVKERDVLIEQVFEEDGKHPWVPTRRSVLIAAGEIRTIEFEPEKEDDDVKPK
ncbi:DUF6338 family protein [Methylobacterium ajmalii]|uniref:DUF6338 family protein n=1 Tax=Methylobacterium ajmalii TaxID=2738439 RepID=UPI003D15C9F6